MVGALTVGALSAEERRGEVAGLISCGPTVGGLSVGGLSVGGLSVGGLGTAAGDLSSEY